MYFNGSEFSSTSGGAPAIEAERDREREEDGSFRKLGKAKNLLWGMAVVRAQVEIG